MMRNVLKVHGFVSTAALLALGLALPVSCGLSVGGIPPSGSGGGKHTASSANSGQGGGLFGDSTSAASGTGGASSSSSSGSSSGSGTGGGPIAVWRSWDVQSSSNPPKLSVVDIQTGGAHEAMIIPYQSISLMDLGVDAALTFFNPGVHPDAFNNVQNFWTIPSALYPYVGKSSVPRGSSMGAPMPPGVYDLQVFPPMDKTKLVVAGFVVPLEADYTLSSLAVQRVPPTPAIPGDHAQLLVFVGSTAVKTANLTGTKNQQWVIDPKTYSLGHLMPNIQVNFGVTAADDSMGDATAVVWMLTAM